MKRRRPTFRDEEVIQMDSCDSIKTTTPVLKSCNTLFFRRIIMNEGLSINDSGLVKNLSHL